MKTFASLQNKFLLIVKVTYLFIMLNLLPFTFEGNLKLKSNLHKWHPCLYKIQVNKVTLKMDVAYTEHSHVIGKGGGNIKKVMEVTSCHIHFPDSNRHNVAGEKSNQVTLTPQTFMLKTWKQAYLKALYFFLLWPGVHCWAHRRSGGSKEEDKSEWSKYNLSWDYPE